MSKFILNMGIHNGGIMSRDHCPPKEFDTLQEAINDFNDARKFFASLGYYIWYANIKDGAGKEVWRNNGVSYRW